MFFLGLQPVWATRGKERVCRAVQASLADWESKNEDEDRRERQRDTQREREIIRNNFCITIKVSLLLLISAVSFPPLSSSSSWSRTCTTPPDSPSLHRREYDPGTPYVAGRTACAQNSNAPALGVKSMPFAHGIGSAGHRLGAR